MDPSTTWYALTSHYFIDYSDDEDMDPFADDGADDDDDFSDD